MLTFLVVGSLWFWLFLAAELVLLIAYVESEKPAVQFATPISIVTFIVLLELGGSVDIFGFINNNKLLTGLLILGYIALGAVWGVFKWWLFCRNEFDKYAAAKAKFLRKNGIVGQADTTIPESLRANWRKTTVLADADDMRDHFESDHTINQRREFATITSEIFSTLSDGAWLAAMEDAGADVSWLSQEQ